MAKYLGEEIINVKNGDNPFKFYTPMDWALYFIGRYGQIDGDHHKTWVLDQVARILLDSNITVKLAKWDDGQQEYRVTVDEDKEPQRYTDWVKKMKAGEDGPDTYGYDTGICP
jgi:hypothetical protein